MNTIKLQLHPYSFLIRNDLTERLQPEACGEGKVYSFYPFEVASVYFYYMVTKFKYRIQCIFKMNTISVAYVS